MEYEKFYISRRGFNILEIAAPKAAFNLEAFEFTEERIPNYKEIQNKFIVQLDPIIMVRGAKGRFIVTAWGDEANDKLVINEINN